MSLRIAAGVLIVAGVTSLLMPRESAANVTFSEVQATVERTQTMTCTMTDQTTPAAETKEEPYRLLIRGPNLVRLEQADGGYTITDFGRRKSVLIDPAHKTVRILEGLAVPANASALNFYELFRSSAANPIKTLPSREIGGKKAIGFIVRGPILKGDSHQPKGPKPEITVQVRDFAGRTDKGIRMGANRAAIEKAYGAPGSVREARNKDMFGKRAANPEQKTGQVDLSYNALGLSFSLHDDALDSILISAPRPPAKTPAQPAGAPTKP